MTKIILRYLTLADQKEFEKVLREDWGHFDFAHYWQGLANSDFSLYVKILPEFSEGKHIAPTHVPFTFLFAFNEKGELVGRTSIRHILNDYLSQWGGHIGYGVSPSHRQKGYATAILKETLHYVRNNLKELDRVLLTCDDDNIGSFKTIEKNGGVLENTIADPNGVLKRRYWISLWPIQSKNGAVSRVKMTHVH